MPGHITLQTYHHARLLLGVLGGLRIGRTVAALLLAAFLLGPCAAPDTQAMDPVTIGILGPILMPYAISAAKWVGAGMVRTIPSFINFGVDVLNILRLPLGVLQTTLLWPFGYLSYGLENIWDGGTAPFKMIYHLIIEAPMRFAGFT